MTRAQARTCRRVLEDLAPGEAHHGDAIGADAEFHDVAQRLGVRLVVHPPLEPRHRAFRMGDRVEKPARYKVRNRALVDEADVVVGAPAAPQANSPHSGTWYTLRYALRAGKRVMVLWPDGGAEWLTEPAGDAT